MKTASEHDQRYEECILTYAETFREALGIQIRSSNAERLQKVFKSLNEIGKKLQLIQFMP